MEIDEIARIEPALSRVVERIKEVDGISTLYPPQAEAIEKGALGDGNLLLVVPTSTGKTLVAELACLQAILKHKKKALYMVPLRALASEKYAEFREKYEPLGVRVAVSTGDYDSTDVWLDSYDLIIASVEKVDSLLRHSAPWISRLGVVVSDEIHMLDDPSRGPTLEVVLSRLRRESRARIIALSATIGNRRELAEWLDAVLVDSDYRPVTLHEGVYHPGGLVFEDGAVDENLVIPPFFGGAQELVRAVVKTGRQCLVFVSSKRSTETEAERVAPLVEPLLSPEEKEELSSISKKILGALSQPTQQCEKLASLVEKGVAFHHSGLVSEQRALIEEGFRRGLIKCICATTTLAYGVNLPCDYVIVRDVYRYMEGAGSVPIPVLEYKQCAGRAGRARYAREGWSVIIAKSETQAEGLMERYVRGEPEEIFSKLSVAPMLRMHLLSLVATASLSTMEAIESFFGSTFFAHQYRDQKELARRIGSILERFLAYGLVALERDEYVATRLGKRVAELYIDPESACLFLDFLSSCSGFSLEDPDLESLPGRETEEESVFTPASELQRKKEYPPLGVFHLACSCPELRPLVRVSRMERELYAVLSDALSSCLYPEPPGEWSIEWDEHLSSLKTAMVLKAWIDGATEREINERFGLAPGGLRAKVEMAEWLLYAFSEIARLVGRRDAHSFLSMLRERVRHGVPRELLPLVRIPGIGRARARRLYDRGIRSPRDLLSTPEEVLASILGKKTARRILGEARKLLSPGA